MGLMEKAKQKLGMEEKEDGASFEDEFEEPSGDEVEVEEEGFEDEPESEEPEWDTAYQFADDVIGECGFAGVKEFVDKSMMYRIDQSPLYRDQIESGLRTMNRISDSMRSVHELQEDVRGDSSDKDYQKYAEEVRAANDLIDELDRMEGKEEQYANEIISIANDAVDALKERSVDNGSVNSDVGVTRE